MSGFEDTIPDDIHTSYVNTINGEEDAPLETVFTQQSTTLVSFFALQLVDIPLCFQKTKSLYSPTASIPKLRFLNMLMRHGKKAKMAKAYALALHTIAQVASSKHRDVFSGSSWRHLYAAFNQVHFTQNVSKHGTPFPSLLPTAFSLLNVDEQPYTADAYYTPEEDWFQNCLLDELEQHLPIFSFFVKKVDKMKRKHSRGKTGKYSISWKYVPKYKRFIATLRWLTRDVRFQKAKTFNLRLLRSLETLLFDRQSHLVFQLRQFVHRFAYQNHKKTLLHTLKSTS